MQASTPIHPLPSRLSGPICGLTGFALALLAGLLSSGEATVVLLRAMISCLGCYGMGLAVGHVLEVVALRVVERERALVRSVQGRPAGSEDESREQDA
ncbi:MAG: hypothetical protein KatS3mg103_0207 [Phycisphaerales bacterium]|nr:MAG: hypothetical protein KatS3mg103_0207 [Phycisphaerales bacterium]